MPMKNLTPLLTDIIFDNKSNLSAIRANFSNVRDIRE